MAHRDSPVGGAHSSDQAESLVYLAHVHPFTALMGTEPLLPNPRP